VIAAPIAAPRNGNHSQVMPTRPAIDITQSTLWAAAAMVAASAAPASPASFLPPSGSGAQLTRPEVPAYVAAPVAPHLAPQAAAQMAPQVAASPAVDPNAIPAAMIVQQGPDSIQWFVFGGTFAFLAVILIAIWIIAAR
jgi:hypothetical protein